MVGALIQRRPTAGPDALARLQQHNLVKLHARLASYRHPDLLRAIETSVDGLGRSASDEPVRRRSTAAVPLG